MVPVSEVYAQAGVGLVGDRYALGTGTHSDSFPLTTTHVTLISAEAIVAANREAKVHFEPEDTRRNIVITGFDFGLLVGREFLVGTVQMKWAAPCNSCDRPSELSGKPGFGTVFAGRGGIRARVLADGRIRQGSGVRVLSPLAERVSR